MEMNHAESYDPTRIKVWKMLLGCIAIYCTISAFIIVIFPGHALRIWWFFTYITGACTFLPLPTHHEVMIMGKVSYDNVSST